MIEADGVETRASITDAAVTNTTRLMVKRRVLHPVPLTSEALHAALHLSLCQPLWPAWPPALVHLADRFSPSLYL